MFTFINQIFSHIRLFKLKQAFEKDAIFLPHKLSPSPYKVSLQKFGQGPSTLILQTNEFVDPILEIKLFKKTAQLSFLVESFLIDLEEPVLDSMVCALHLDINKGLSDASLMTYKLEAGNLCALYVTNLPLSKLSVSSIQKAVNFADKCLKSVKVLDRVNEYYLEYSDRIFAGNTPENEDADALEN